MSIVASEARVGKTEGGGGRGTRCWLLASQHSRRGSRQAARGASADASCQQPPGTARPFPPPPPPPLLLHLRE